MPLNVWQRSVVDHAGNVMPGASVEVRDQATSNLVQLYSDYDGEDSIGNPITADENGFVRFYVAAGRYRIEATSGDLSRVWEDEVLGLDGALIEHRRTAAEISASVVPVSLQYEPGDIRRNGAVDGADSSEAINDALKSNKQVWVPATGTYLFADLRIPSGVTFFSKGGTLKFKDNTAVSGATSYFPISTSADGSTPGVADNVTIRDLVIDGNKANNLTYLVCDAITVAGTNVQVLNNRITNPPDSGIMWSGVNGGRLIGNYITGAPDAGIYANDSNGSFEARVSVIAHNVCVSCAEAGIAVKRHLSLLTVNNNTTYECGVGINTEDFGGGINPNYVSITGNVCVRSGFGAGASGAGLGIYAQGPGVGMVVNDNLIYDSNNAGLVIGGTKYSTYVGNVIVGTSSGTANSHGIWVISDTGKSNDYNTIAYNKVANVDGYGIWLQDNVVAANVGNKVIGNTVRDSGNEGLRWDATYTNGELLDNDLDGTTNDLDYAVANGTNVNNRVDGNILRNGNINGNTGWQTGSYQHVFGDGAKTTHGNGSPTVGTWEVDSSSRQTPSAADGNNMVLFEYRCTAAGTPGTWIALRASTVSPAT